MGLGKRFLAFLLGSLLLFSSFAFSPLLLTAEEEPVEIYASDLRSFVKKEQAGWRSVCYDVDISGGGIGLTNDGDPVPYDKGIVAHANSEVEFNVSTLKVTKFSAYVGIEDCPDTNNPQHIDSIGASFTVKLDGVEKLTTEQIGYRSALRLVEVDIPEETETVTLVTTHNGYTSGEHTAWADAKFTFSSVEGLTIDSLALDAEVLTLPLDTEATLTKDIGDSKPVVEYYSFESSDPSVATVSAEGKVTAVAPGITTVTLREKYSRLEASTEVHVSLADVGRDWNVWTLQNGDYEHPPVYDASNPNKITLSLPEGDIKNTAAESQMLLTDAPDGDFEITVKVNGGLTTPYWSTGLTLYASYGNQITVERRYHTGYGNNCFCLATFTSGTYHEPHATEPEEKTEDAAYLRLVRKGDLVHGYYKYDGDAEWTEITGDWSEDICAPVLGEGDLKIGLITRRGIGVSPTDHRAEFENFTLKTSDGEQVIPFAHCTEGKEILFANAMEKELAMEQTGSPKLPESFMAYLSDGSLEEIAIEWEDFDASKVGQTTLTGRPAAESGFADSGFTVAVAVTVTERISFDLTGDELLSIRDVSRLLMNLGSGTSTASDPDVNFDGQTTIADVAVLLLILSEWNA